jgi:hypothetical protein
VTVNVTVFANASVCARIENRLGIAFCKNAAVDDGEPIEPVFGAFEIVRRHQDGQSTLDESAHEFA